MPGAEQPSTDALAERQVCPLVRAGPLGGYDPLAIAHEKQMVSSDGDRHRVPPGEKVVRAEANPLWPDRLSHRDRRPARGDRR